MCRRHLRLPSSLGLWSYPSPSSPLVFGMSIHRLGILSLSPQSRHPSTPPGLSLPLRKHALSYPAALLFDCHHQAGNHRSSPDRRRASLPLVSGFPSPAKPFLALSGTQRTRPRKPPYDTSYLKPFALGIKP